MQALGLIETRGLIAAIESADAMLKSAEVTLLEKTLVGGGLVTIAVGGDVGAVKAAVEAAHASINKINSTLLVSKHVIPRPHSDLEGLIIGPLVKDKEVADKKPMMEKEEEPEVSSEEIVSDDIMEITGQNALAENEDNTLKKEENELHKEDLDRLMKSSNLDEVISVLEKQTVVKLRKLAREYSSIGIMGREISKADKQLLITKLREYYMNNRLE